jgi:SAM-dependent methyltransferase
MPSSISHQQPTRRRAFGSDNEWGVVTPAAAADKQLARWFNREDTCGLIESEPSRGRFLLAVLFVCNALGDPVSGFHAHNARAWDALARQGVPLAQPATDAELRDPLPLIDPAGWLGDLRGQHVLCLAAGGGRHSALYAAAGARVSVVDISAEMLALDRAIAGERGFDIRIVQTSMDDLSMLVPASFDAVVHPVSTCYVPHVKPVFAAVARVLRRGGLYVSQHKSPTSLQASRRPDGSGYAIDEPYYRTGPLPAAEGASHLRETGTLEFLHRWEELVGGICRAGFVIEDLVEPVHAKPQAAAGSFAHRAHFVAPYVRIKARRLGSSAPSSGPIVVRD